MTAPHDEASTSQLVHAAERSVWFVGAYTGGEDKTEEFVAEGFWRCGHQDKYADEINAMRPGDRIAIKATYTRKHRLPFDAKGHTVSVMSIKATGTITGNPSDGRTVEVDWDPPAEPREWYFFTNQRTVWRVRPGVWREDGLIDFAFDRRDQDLDRFRNHPFWAGRFGDDAIPAADAEDGAEEEVIEEPQDVEDEYSAQGIIDDGSFVPLEVLEDYLTALSRKKNVILQGPPGTGKTWLAKRLAYALIGRKDRALVRALQFHPSVSYEDFVRGWRPTGDGRLALTDGVFLQIVNEAQAHPNNPYVVVIEEINRADLARVFGELLTLLESDKRRPDEALELTYRHPDEEPLYLPENLYLIGTMNLADRSLAIVDFALRRRFSFFDLEPMLNDAWQDWVADRNQIPRPFLTALAARVDALNQKISEDPALGEQYRIGHSFFTPRDPGLVTDPHEWIRTVVDGDIRPLLAEYWFDDPARATDEAAALSGSPR